MALQDFNQLQLARWRASGQDIDTYLKNSGLHDEGYVFDQAKNRFDHPDAYLTNVDPDSIPSAAGRLRARAVQGIQELTNPRQGTGSYRPTVTESGNPILGWSDSRTPITGFKSGLSAGTITSEPPVNQIRSTPQIGNSLPGFSIANRTAPTAFGVRQQATLGSGYFPDRTLIPPPIRTDAAGPHVQIDPRYGGGEGSVRYNVPPTTPGYINGVQVEGLTPVPSPNILALLKRYGG